MREKYLELSKKLRKTRRKTRFKRVHNSKRTWAGTYARKVPWI